MNAKHRPNDYETHRQRIDAARETMGARYLCHPANRVQRIQRGPRVGADRGCLETN